MRIVYVLTSLGMGGAEKQALALAEHMASCGHTVALLTLMPRAAEEWPTELRVVALGIRKNPIRAMVGSLQARRFLRAFQPDLVHSHSFHGNMLARLLACTLPGLKVISTVHNVYEGGWMRMLAYRITDGASVRTIAVSEAAAQRFMQLKAVPGNKCGAIANGIAVGEFVPDARRRALTRAALGLRAEASGTTFVWIAVGRVAPAKDYPNLLRALAEVRKIHAGVQLWIAGETNGSNFAECNALAYELVLSGAVRWLGLRRDVAALLDAADGFVLASAWEGMPLAAGEAMAMAKPVVATDVGGVREIVGDAGRIVPSHDSGALAEAMLDVMQASREEREACGCAARKRIIERFSMGASVDKWEKVYREMVP